MATEERKRAQNGGFADFCPVCRFLLSFEISGLSLISFGF